MKLSNAVKFSKDSNPCFVVYCRFKPGVREPTEVYFQHFWTSLIGLSLKAGRESHKAGLELNKRKFSINFKDEDCSEKNVAVDIYNSIKGIGADYEQQKITLTKILGYEDNPATATFTLGHDKSIKDLVDLNLGIIDSLPIKYFKLTDNRFGVPTEIDSSEAGIIKIQAQPVDKCIIILRNTRLNKEVSWPGVIFAPGLPNLPESERRVRFVSDDLEIVLYFGGQSNAVLKSIQDENISPIQASRNLLTRALFDSEPIEVEIWSRGLRVVSGHINIDQGAGNDRWWAELSDAFNEVINIIPAERLPDGMSVNLRKIIEERASLIDFSSQISNDQATLSINVDIDSLKSNISEFNKVILPVVYDLCGFSVIATVVRDVKSTVLIDSIIEIDTPTGRISRAAILPGSPENHLDFITREVMWAEQHADSSSGAVLSIRPSELST